jgi:hypothetical protein
MKNNNIVILLLTLLISVSCGDDYLTLTPKESLSDANFFQNETDAQAALIGCYERMQEGSAWGGSEIAAYIEWGMTHDMYEMDRSVQRVELWSLRLPPGNNALRSVYVNAYQGINRTNLLISKVSAMENLDSNTKDLILGQARFIRGAFYFILVKYFGGVPLILEPMSSSDDMNIPRASSEAIWNQVIDDFDNAANVLPLSWEDNKTGRVTKTAAWAFLAKSYVHQANWNKVIEYCENIIGSSQHHLLSNFIDVFREDNENNEELIFSIQHSQEPGQTSVLSYRSAPRGAPGQYVGRAAWSNYVPNNQWVDALERNNEGVIKDERYWHSVIGPGEKHQYTDYVLPDPAPVVATRTGYILTKYWQGYWNPTSPINVPVIRYPEILLLYAEALNETGRQTDAMEQVNLIRTRSKLEPKPLDLPKEEVLDAIFTEYRFEFMWEPVGGFGTLNRRGRFLDFLEDNFEGFETLEVDQKPWVQTNPILMPIPITAYQTNKALVQNPGYPPF